ncbi:MAG TPA: diguanylate cyclase [Solirubrobacterales bacterium]|nr:diguanylate cyclase [Solirubrobacterales bacterium]
MIALGGKIPALDSRARPRTADRRLRAADPSQLLSGPAAARPVALSQAYLAAGAAVTGTAAALLPHPDYFDVTGLLLVQAAAALWALFMFVGAGRIPFWVMRLGPALATVMTTIAVYFSGDATSGYSLLYLWVGLYVFYFPLSRVDAALNVLWAFGNYAVAIAITPSPAAGAEDSTVSHFVITAGTLVTAATLLTYLRGRVEKLLARLTDAARTDALTGLPNRVALHEILERELERAKPERRPVSLLVIDIDRFKRVNERYGIGVGDEIVRRFGSALEEKTRLIDFVGRSGGEEFAIVLPEADQNHAYLFADELLERVRSTFSPPQVEITASIGIASTPSHAENPAGLLAAADQALGAAKALGRDRAVIYSPEVTNVLSSIAGRRSVESQAHVATVLSLAEALDQRDSSTARHSQTVGRLCEMMARQLELDDDRVHRVRLAGILHDIGKIGVPDSILRKPGPLTNEERDQMRRHPEIGARILSSQELDDVREWILMHHERPDGKGYPRGLTADEIPLEAAILAVGDAFEAMTTDRIYRPAIGQQAAREEVRRCAGSQFDPMVVEALIEALEREGAPVL